MNIQDQNTNDNDTIGELNSLLSEFQETNRKFEESDAQLAKEIQEGLTSIEAEFSEIDEGLNGIEEAYS